jgi:hypothetical protein
VAILTFVLVVIISPPFTILLEWIAAPTLPAYLVRGYLAKAIAAELKISRRTVEVFYAKIFKKLHLERDAASLLIRLVYHLDEIDELIRLGTDE